MVRLYYVDTTVGYYGRVIRRLLTLVKRGVFQPALILPGEGYTPPPLHPFARLCVEVYAKVCFCAKILIDKSEAIVCHKMTDKVPKKHRDIGIRK